MNRDYESRARYELDSRDIVEDPFADIEVDDMEFEDDDEAETAAESVAWVNGAIVIK